MYLTSTDQYSNLNVALYGIALRSRGAVSLGEASAISAKFWRYLSSISWHRLKLVGQSRASILCIIVQYIVAANPHCPAYPGNELISHRFVILSLHHSDFLANVCYTLPTYAGRGLFFSSKYGMLKLGLIAEKWGVRCRNL